MKESQETMISRRSTGRSMTERQENLGRLLREVQIWKDRNRLARAALQDSWQALESLDRALDIHYRGLLEQASRMTNDAPLDVVDLGELRRERQRLRLHDLFTVQQQRLYAAIDHLRATIGQR